MQRNDFGEMLCVLIIILFVTAHAKVITIGSSKESLWRLDAGIFHYHLSLLNHCRENSIFFIKFATRKKYANQDIQKVSLVRIALISAFSIRQASSSAQKKNASRSLWGLDEEAATSWLAIIISHFTARCL